MSYGLAQARYASDTAATVSPSRLLIMLYDRLVADLGSAHEAPCCARTGRPAASGSPAPRRSSSSCAPRSTSPRGRTATAWHVCTCGWSSELMQARLRPVGPTRGRLPRPRRSAPRRLEAGGRATRGSGAGGRSGRRPGGRGMITAEELWGAYLDAVEQAALAVERQAVETGTPCRPRCRNRRRPGRRRWSRAAARCSRRSRRRGDRPEMPGRHGHGARGPAPPDRATARGLRRWRAPRRSRLRTLPAPLP